MLVHHKSDEIYAIIRKTSDNLATHAFSREIGGIQSSAHVRHPTYIINPKHIEIGENFIAGPGLRIEAWDKFYDQRFQPSIEIGNNVCINWNCHIGAISCIEIHDNVLVGSNVLITDHFHGSINNEDLLQTPATRPLVSEGRVVIEQNVWIGEGVAILFGVRIGEGSIIGANSVVTKDVPKFSVVAGVPGRILRSLSPESLSERSDDFNR